MAVTFFGLFGLAGKHLRGKKSGGIWSRAEAEAEAVAVVVAHKRRGVNKLSRWAGGGEEGALRGDRLITLNPPIWNASSVNKCIWLPLPPPPTVMQLLIGRVKYRRPFIKGDKPRGFRN